jgi:hypothetical protein
VLKSSVMQADGTMLSCLRRSSTSTTYENRDKRFRTNEKTKITRMLHIIFFLWLVVSVALILTAISQRRAIIDLLRTASSASTPATLTLLLRLGIHGLTVPKVWHAICPLLIGAEKRHVEDFCHRSSHRMPVGS